MKVFSAPMSAKSLIFDVSKSAIQKGRDEWTGDAVIEKSVKEYLMNVFPGKSPREIFVRPAPNWSDAKLILLKI